MYKENDQLPHYDNRYKSRIVSLGLDVNGAETSQGWLFQGVRYKVFYCTWLTFDGFSSSEGKSDIYLLYKIYTIRIRCPVRHYGQKGCLDGKNRNEKACQIVAKSGEPSTLNIRTICL